ncbi:recombinase family protein [Asticcacaulis tiandongensis]|uniref:recombinase family protein n=1 Tax=Asticcacaulis tiandongensis TaxID=2565365 RepID=UPI0011296EA7|nr:recombinase family protein [Asticcacaulis tiandongensis]
MTKVQRLRCAIYTRKSSEEGLEQDFNSLHAQREACEAFIRSQKHEGWIPVCTTYDDGGISGGTMNRPALQSLLKDVEAQKVDIIVVYKVDRLTRSLADFARMVELFDRQGVSFVSVTQQFNTTSSMGRLTLNVLLSFAQFEREVTGERIRDKIRASKAKGMFMGGTVPLGYAVKTRKLLIQPEDGELVRLIFRLYLELGNVRLLKAHLETHGLKRQNNPYPWSAGMLYALLRNSIYIGKIVHKGIQHQGLHEPLIDQALWDQVQAQLTANKQGRHTKPRLTEATPLIGKLFDPQGEPMVPSHTQRKGRRYQYYVSKSLTKGATEASQGWRLSARMLEGMIISANKSILKSGCVQCPDDGRHLTPHQHLRLNMRMPEVVGQFSSAEILSLVHRVEIEESALNITLDLTSLLQATGMQAATKLELSVLSIHAVPATLQRRHNELRLVLNAATSPTLNKDDTLIRNVARGHVWFRQWLTGEVRTIKDIAEREGLGREYVADVMHLAFLSPEMVQSILEGKQPQELNSRKLLSKDAIPLSWAQQSQQWIKS